MQPAVSTAAYRARMAGASGATARVTHLNANWSPDGGFELLVVTEDGNRDSVPIPADDLAALGAILRRDEVLLWDPEARTLILANVVGEWLPRDWSKADRGATPKRG